MEDLSGQSIGRYHLIEKLGVGGMATVYKAFDTRLERMVAFKILRTDMFAPVQLQEVLARFEREARTLARLDHPGIVRIYDFGRYEGAPYLVMPCLSGGTLKERIRGVMPWREGVSLLLFVAKALAYAHENGMVHRDIKPANILIGDDGRPVISDFGVAKILETEQGGTLTPTGVGIGTPEYMSPEQGQGVTVDARSDIYSLGVVFYELVTGRKPYMANTPLAVVLKHMNDPLPRPRQFVPGLPSEVENVIFKALAKKPEERYATMAEFAHALADLVAAGTDLERRQGQQNFSRPASTSKSRIPFWIVAGGGVALLGLCGLVVMGILAGMNGLGPMTFLISASPTRTILATADETLALQETPTSQLTSIPSTTPIPVITQTPSPGIGSTTVSAIDGMTLVYVPAGSFLMGSTESEINALMANCSVCDRAYFQPEIPQHSVYLDSYWIDRTEVTNAMYAQCVASGACDSPHDTGSYTRNSYYGNPQYADYPVVNVDWEMAEAYCAWAGRRLPGEAEWEKAARGTDGGLYPWGSQPPTAQLSNYDELEGDTTQVGSYPLGASPYGVLDMAGNVWEWVNDWFGENYYSMSPSENPGGPNSGTFRGLHGGSWALPASDIRPAFRGWGYYWGDVVGFRCAVSKAAP